MIEFFLIVVSKETQALETIFGYQLRVDPCAES